jgi:hypothetical protein
MIRSNIDLHYRDPSLASHSVDAPQSPPQPSSYEGGFYL